MDQLCGTIKASAAGDNQSTGLGFKGGFSASAQTAYSQYCNTSARRLLPPVSEMRQDYRGMSLKQVNPALWDDFMSINNSFERTGIPAFIKGQIVASLNTYEHKRRNGNSRLELNDTMPPPPGGHIRPRQVRSME